MSKYSLKVISVAAAVAGAATMAAAMVPSSANAAHHEEKCYGVSKVGENACASASGSHSCAGQATIDFDGGEWKKVDSGSCVQMGGKLEPFEGVNETTKTEG